MYLLNVEGIKAEQEGKNAFWTSSETAQGPFAHQLTCTGLLEPLGSAMEMLLSKPCWAPRSHPFHHPTRRSWSKQTALCCFYSILHRKPLHGAGAVPVHESRVRGLSRHSSLGWSVLHSSFLSLCLYNTDFQLCENTASSGHGVKPSPKVLCFAKPCAGHFPQPSSAECLGGGGELLIE